MDTILFDLDGTLLPVDQDNFMKVYFSELTKKCATHGFGPPEATVSAVWAGTKAMVKNDGSANNETVFWDTFAAHLGEDVMSIKPSLHKFYEEEFENVRVATRPNPMAAQVIEQLRGKGYHLVLASNPLFPLNAYRTRMAWVGLSPEDFDHVTTYECAHFCKPNPRYYQEILQHIGKQPEQCLMVGNDVQEDGCAKTLGMELYLVTDDLINKNNDDITTHNHGSFEAFCQYAQTAL